MQWRTWKKANIGRFSTLFRQGGVKNQISKLRMMTNFHASFSYVTAYFSPPSFSWHHSGALLTQCGLVPCDLALRRRLDPYPSRPPQTARFRGAWSAAMTLEESPTRPWFWWTGQRGGASLYGRAPPSDSRGQQLGLHAPCSTSKIEHSKKCAES